MTKERPVTDIKNESSPCGHAMCCNQCFDVYKKCKELESLCRDERLLAERDAMAQAYYELHMNHCTGCGATEEGMKEEILAEAARILEGKGKN